ncbi:FAD:protein FMN transferase [Arthrobacter sp. TWP1-1]|uniref:FAD:protein FMN transferase n=1 Tax=Arthrobacter sp. TWP1-1 TaxID=2804568 RepID=UPI003CEC290E
MVRTWKVWGLEATVAVTNQAAAAAAEVIVRSVIDDVDLACSRFRADSELTLLASKLADGAQLSPTLAHLVSGALDAARWTDGDVDPTLGNDMNALGYDRDFTEIHLNPLTGAIAHQVRRRNVGWRDVRLEGDVLTVPESLRLDLGATAKAAAADRAARRIFGELRCGALVSLGGDIATAGPAPGGGWQVLVQDTLEDPAQQISLVAGKSVATSSTQKRRWQHNGRSVHHILDPRFGLPASEVWRSVSVAASSCLAANAFSTAGVVRGFAAVQWFRDKGISGRFVDQRGRVVVTGGWPQQEFPESDLPKPEFLSSDNSWHGVEAGVTSGG